MGFSSWKDSLQEKLTLAFYADLESGSKRRKGRRRPLLAIAEDDKVRDVFFLLTTCTELCDDGILDL